MSDSEVVIYTTRFCPYCVRAKSLLTQKEVSFKEIPVDGDQAKRQEMMHKAGQHTVPQIWIGEHHVGGCDELFMLERAGTLDSLLRTGN
jgi:glutaredoxin 3